MTKSVKISLILVAGFALLIGVGVYQARAQAGKSAVVWPAADIKWADNPAVKGAKIAVLWGDPKTGAYGSLKGIPGGSKLAQHTHSQDQRVIAVAGSIVLALDGGAPKELPPGSYAFIPAGLKHTADCKAGADCTYFEEQPGASDIKFVEAPKPSN